MTPHGHRTRWGITAAADPEDLYVDERLILTPLAGVFHPVIADVSVDQPLRIDDGDEIGTIIQSGEKHPVSSRFTGLLVGMLVLPGERVRAHQPVAWLRTDPLARVMGPPWAVRSGGVRMPRSTSHLPPGR